MSMRVGLVIDTFNLGGAESMVFETARLLKESGQSPVLFHFGSEYVSQCAINLGIEHYVIPNHKLYKKGILLPLFILKTLRLINGKKLDILHSHLFSPIFTFAIIAKLVGIKHVGTLHDTYMIEDSPKRIWLIKLARLLNTQLIAVSEPMKQFYTEHANFETGAVRYIPNFASKNNQLSQRAEIREKLGLNSADIAIFSVGRLVQLKQFNILISAISKIDTPKVKAFIVGNGTEFETLQAQILKLNLESKVTLLGERSDIEDLLSAADIFTLTSSTEGMSKSILEALASGLPIIATDVGGNKDLVLNEENGYLLKQHCPEELANRIDRLSADKALREQMSISSMELLEEKYTSNIFLANHIRLYQEKV